MGTAKVDIHRDIIYEPLPSQGTFHDSIARFKGFSGPVGSGKSRALVHEAIRLTMVNPGLLGLIGAPTYPMLRDVTQRAIFEELEDNDIPFEFRKQENLLTMLDTGSEIIFRSLDTPDRLRGTNLAWFGIDELTYCHEQAWLRLQARLRHPLASELCGFGVWTPNGFDWVYDRFIGPEKLSGYDAILAQPYENTYLPGDFYATLQCSYDAKFAAQEVLGQYLSLQSGQVYYAFSRTENIATCEYVPSLQLCWALDFNVDPMCSVICQIDGTRVEVLDEIVLPNSNTQAACDEFWRRVESMIRPAPGTRVLGPTSLRVYGDSAGSHRQTAAVGKSDYTIIKEFFRRIPQLDVSYHVPVADPAVKDRVNAVNAKLKSAAGIVGMLIDPRCKWLTRDLERVNWKADKSGNTTGDIEKKSAKNKDLTHVSDALGYLVEREFPLVTKPDLFAGQSVGQSDQSPGDVNQFDRPSAFRMPGNTGGM
jgi:hypothetical protein